MAEEMTRASSTNLIVEVHGGAPGTRAWTTLKSREVWWQTRATGSKRASAGRAEPCRRIPTGSLVTGSSSERCPSSVGSKRRGTRPGDTSRSIRASPCAVGSRPARLSQATLTRADCLVEGGAV